MQLTAQPPKVSYCLCTFRRGSVEQAKHCDTKEELWKRNLHKTVCRRCPGCRRARRPSCAGHAAKNSRHTQAFGNDPKLFPQSCHSASAFSALEWSMACYVVCQPEVRLKLWLGGTVEMK